MTLLWPQKLDWTVGFDMFKKGNLVKRWSAVKVGKRHLTAGETTPKGLDRGDLTKRTSYEIHKLSAGHGIIILNVPGTMSQLPARFNRGSSNIWRLR